MSAYWKGGEKKDGTGSARCSEMVPGSAGGSAAHRHVLRGPRVASLVFPLRHRAWVDGQRCRDFCGPRRPLCLDAGHQGPR